MDNLKKNGVSFGDFLEAEDHQFTSRLPTRSENQKYVLSVAFENDENVL